MYLKELEINNYGPFGEGIRISFDENHSEILIIGESDTEGFNSNGSGKTKFASAAFWCIFGVPLVEEETADEVIRNGESVCNVKALLIDNSDTYLISRTRSLNDTNTLEFYVNDSLINDKTTTPSEVQKDVNRYLSLKGTGKQSVSDILSTNFLSYNSVDMFVSKRVSSAERFAFISRMFDLDKWIECKENAQSKIDDLSPIISSLNGKLSAYENRLSSLNEDSLKKEIDSSINKKKEYSSELEELEDSNVSLSALKEKSFSIKSILETSNIAFNEFKSYYTEKIWNHEVAIDDIKFSINEAEQTLDSYKSKYEKEPDTNRVTELDTVLKELTLNEKGIAESLVKIKDILSEKERMKSSALSCPVCKTKLFLSKKDLVEFDLEEITKEINDLHSESLSLDLTKAEVELTIESTKLEREALNQSLIAQQGIASEKENLKKEEEILATITKEYNSMLDEKQAKIFALNVELSQINKELDALLLTNNEITRKISTLKSNISDMDGVVAKNKALLEERESLLSTIKSLKRELEDSLKEVEQYKYWKKAFLDIRRLIIQSILPQLEDISNTYLKEMGVPFEIVLDTLREYKTTKNLKEEFNVKINDKSAGITMPIHLRSTGERKRIGIAVCMALLDLKEQINPKNIGFRFFDEVLDNLDETGIDYFLTLLSKSDYQNFVISHNDALKNRFNKVITIKKTNGVSYL